MSVRIDGERLESINNCVSILDGDISSMLNHLNYEDKVLVEDDIIGIAVCLVEDLSDNDAEPGPHGEEVLLDAEKLEYCQALHNDIMTMVSSLQINDVVPNKLLAKTNALLEVLNRLPNEEEVL